MAPLPHRFERSLNVDALAPRHSGVGETVAGAASARDVHSLPPQVPEGFRYHQNGIMGQRWSVLGVNMAEKHITDKKWEEEARACLIKQQQRTGWDLNMTVVATLALFFLAANHSICRFICSVDHKVVISLLSDTFNYFSHTPIITFDHIGQ